MKKTVVTVLISAFLILGMAVADYAVNGSFIPVNTSEIVKKRPCKLYNRYGNMQGAK